MRFFLVLFLVYSAAAFALPLCESLVSPEQYRFGQHLTYNDDLFAHSRKPEPGSLEDRHPGVVKRITTIMYRDLPYVEWPFLSPMTPNDAREYYLKFDKIEVAILAIPREMNLSAGDSKIFSDMANDIHKTRLDLMRYASPFSRTSQHLLRLEKISTTIQSCLQELIVASLLDGEEFLFHKNSVDHYLGGLPEGFQRRFRRARFALTRMNSEIDIIVKRRNGRTLWIEVKNNMVPWTFKDFEEWCKTNNCASDIDISHMEQVNQRRRDAYFLNGVMEQAQLQVNARESISERGNIDILFVTKHVPTEDTLRRLKEMGIESWPLFLDPQPFREDLFRAITGQTHRDPQ